MHNLAPDYVQYLSDEEVEFAPGELDALEKGERDSLVERRLNALERNMTALWEVVNRLEGLAKRLTDAMKG
ncbi:MAG TPA: hypothetical protein VM223_06735 [Planctomycetota bacterium]|nr:hypothetical protein [Planctomycetota bacterium]